jgi:hypothetical protein
VQAVRCDHDPTARRDPGCPDHPRGNRVIVVPDPLLETPIAAVAWEHVYLATCLDAPSLASFVDDHYAMSPEDLCFPGFSPTDGVWCP